MRCKSIGVGEIGYGDELHALAKHGTDGRNLFQPRHGVDRVDPIQIHRLAQQRGGASAVNM